jgi:hypothetical protein
MTESQPTASWLTNHAERVQQLPEDKRRHCQYLIEQLLSCYTTEQGRALVLLTDSLGEDDQIRLLAVNANETQVQHMVGLLGLLADDMLTPPSHGLN